MKSALSTTAFSNTSGQTIYERTIIHVRNLWQPEISDRLEYLLGLKSGWDGYSGPEVSLQNAHFLLHLLTRVCPPNCPTPHIVPGSDGSLQIEWHSHMFDIEINIMTPYKATAWRSNNVLDEERAEEEIEITNDFKTLSDWISEYSQRSRNASFTAPR
jgi:hypothetical protein